MADRYPASSRPMSSPSRSRRSTLRIALIAIAGAMSLLAAADAVAQIRVGPGNPAGPLANDPIISRPTTIGPIGNGPIGRLGPRLPPPEIDMPGNIRPYGPVVIDNLDDYRRRIGAVRRGTVRIRPTRQIAQSQQTVARGGFNAPPPGETRFVPNEVLLNIAPSAANATLNALARLHHLTRLESSDLALTRRRLLRWRINDGRPVAVVIRALQADPRVVGAVLGAQPNYLYALQEDAAAAKPDPAPAQTDSAQYALAKLHLTEAHAIAKGENVVIAVIDTPIDATHPELAGVITATFDATGAADKPLPHGTGMASAIAAHGKLIGSAPNVKLISVAAFGRVRTQGTTFNIVKGLDWAANANANIINMSFAGPADPELAAMLASARAKGLVLIAAAGNAGPTSPPLYPAADPNVIAVTATDIDDRLFERANRGAYIAVAAPGVNILVAAPDGGYQTTSGTSVAAAEVSGIAALMIERNRKLDPASVRRVLMSTAHDLGPAGPDDQFGAGLTDALGALTALDAKPASLPQVSGPPTPAP